jgi:alpha/beta superfamily hydrolase
MRIILCHGRESGPDGLKVTRLGQVARDRGHVALVPDFRSVGHDPAARLEFLLAWLHDRKRYRDRFTVLVGSSLGGLVASLATRRVPVFGTFLLAPALGTIPPASPHVWVAHGTRDEVVPIDASRGLVRACEMARPATPFVISSSLVRFAELDDDHRLHGSIEFLAQWFDKFLARMDQWQADEMGAS